MKVDRAIIAILFLRVATGLPSREWHMLHSEETRLRQRRNPHIAKESCNGSDAAGCRACRDRWQVEYPKEHISRSIVLPPTSGQQLLDTACSLRRRRRRRRRKRRNGERESSNRVMMRRSAARLFYNSVGELLMNLRVHVTKTWAIPFSQEFAVVHLLRPPKRPIIHERVKLMEAKLNEQTLTPPLRPEALTAAAATGVCVGRCWAETAFSESRQL